MAYTILNQYVIYDSPKDYPGKFVVRRWEISAGRIHLAELLAITDTIESARAAIPPGLCCMEPAPGDDAVIYETWF